MCYISHVTMVLSLHSRPNSYDRQGSFSTCVASVWETLIERNVRLTLPATLLLYYNRHIGISQITLMYVESHVYMYSSCTNHSIQAAR